ncbi:MAG: hypothetical protein DRR08_07650 [Candidatus Parabeggiatoa sp. nov. 2]|nr:MAG: hypothetical protein DRR08_07650 [Gammaproteobacteria bacterium]
MTKYPQYLRGAEKPRKYWGIKTYEREFDLFFNKLYKFYINQLVENNYLIKRYSLNINTLITRKLWAIE